MINSKLLLLNIKKYLCPYCGEWHDVWIDRESCLAEYKHQESEEFYCDEHDGYYFSIKCYDNSIQLRLILCLQGYNYDKNIFTIPITAFTESEDKPIIIAEFDLDNGHFNKKEQKKCCEFELLEMEGCRDCVSYFNGFFETLYKMKIGFEFEEEK